MSQPSVLIAAVSARALAQAARLDGFAPLAADLFADDDTCAIAAAVERLPGGLRRGLRQRPLRRALLRLAQDRTPVGLVVGSGFERHPERLAGIAVPVFGNTAAVVRAVKDPQSLAGLCDRLGIPHPAIRLAHDHTGRNHPVRESPAQTNRDSFPTGDSRPERSPDHAPSDGWISKRAGAAGGSHIRPARAAARLPRSRYLQQRVAGQPVSTLFVANGRACRIIGFSEQWTAPSPRHPVLYGGAVRPARREATLAESLTRVVHALTETTGLRGLCSADFLVAPDGFHLLEINPRPGATLDLFAQPGLFRTHLAGCRGENLPELPSLPGARASAVAYARGPIVLPHGFPWPAWAADRQPAGIPVPRHAPFCTVQADAPHTQGARDLVMQRIDMILRLAEAAQ